MKLLILRHAPAGDRKKFARTGKPDELRPLTPDGKRLMRKAARGLAKIFPSIDLLAASPLVRAAETAEIVRKAYKKSRVEEIWQLEPGAEPSALLLWLQNLRKETAGVVGHEPHLSEVIGYLLTGRTSALTELKKGQACLLEFSGKPKAGGALLLWSLTPRQLKRLA